MYGDSGITHTSLFLLLGLGLLYGAFRAMLNWGKELYVPLHVLSFKLFQVVGIISKDSESGSN